MNGREYNIVEFFSGIGSQIKALQNLKFDCRVQAVCEWDICALTAYDLINNPAGPDPSVSGLTKEELLEELRQYTLSRDGKNPINDKGLNSYSRDVLVTICSAILKTKNLVDINKVNGDRMPDNTDILTYSFPCQDLSNVGAFHGYNKGIDRNSGSRSSLVWQVGQILADMKKAGKNLPRYLIMENVPTLLSPRHRSNFELWKDELADVGYVSKEFQLNAKDFGLPQNRPRLLMMSIFTGDDRNKKERAGEYFESTTSESIVQDYSSSEFFKSFMIRDLLRIPDAPGTDLWKEAVECTPNDTPSRRRIWNENPKIIDENGKFTDRRFIRTITTKQDRHPNAGNIYFDCGIEGRSRFRYLTPRECMLFMGFTDRDYECLVEQNMRTGMQRPFFPRDKIIRMAGNSIPVKLLEGFFYQLYKIERVI